MVEPLRAGRGAGLHGARAGQRRGVGAPGDRGAERRRVHATARQRRRDHGRGPGGRGRARSAEIDFTGTSAQLPNNFNAPSAVCMAAVLYVFRTLVDDDIPLNAGCLKPVSHHPAGLDADPATPASVVAGNVETSHAVTDALYGALGVHGRGLRHDEQLHVRQRAATSTTRRCRAGRGAGDGFDGTDVVQTHMTNSRLTDPEVLEWRFPVRLDGTRSGGVAAARAAGAGGDGGHRRDPVPASR